LRRGDRRRGRSSGRATAAASGRRSRAGRDHRGGPPRARRDRASPRAARASRHAPHAEPARGRGTDRAAGHEPRTPAGGGSGAACTTSPREIRSAPPPSARRSPPCATGPRARRSSGKRTERGDGRPSSPTLELLQPSRPVLLQQARERAVGEERPARLAAGTVVRLVPRVDDPLYRRAADRTRLAVAAVDGHGRTEGGDALRKSGSDFVPQPLRPLTARRTDRVVQPSDLLITQLTRA